jgi:hypothetical protein
LHDERYPYLWIVAKAWDRLEGSLGTVCEGIKIVVPITLERSLPKGNVLGSKPTVRLMSIFAHVPAEKTSGKMLLQRLEKNIVILPDSRELRSDLNEFHSLRLEARNEVAKNGNGVQIRYEAFFWANSYSCHVHHDPEPEMFGSRSLPERRK